MDRTSTSINADWPGNKAPAKLKSSSVRYAAAGFVPIMVDKEFSAHAHHLAALSKGRKLIEQAKTAFALLRSKSELASTLPV